jgi:hypothetical protein
MNLREAAARTLRSITTLRRYIRSGRLRAEKCPGRYGPEYYLTEKDLLDAGLKPESPEALAPVAAGTVPEAPCPTPATLETIPLPLFQELQMKHEQLLVQYGMVRASGMRVMELQNDLESSREQVERLTREVARLKESLVGETRRARKARQEAELELKGKSLEIAALQEKVRGLEMLMRNAVTSETIDQQVATLMGRAQRVGRNLPCSSPPADRPSWSRKKPGKSSGEH